jgi:uncharacterized RDD family membrane protein YckC
VDGDLGRDRPLLRASDADRDKALAVINHALSTGQLGLDEHGERINAALEAKTVEDLNRLTLDLVPPTTPSRQTTSTAPAGWYLDPERAGTQRYFDGTSWTQHLAPLPTAPYGSQGWWSKPSWKGAQLGRPAQGPGALADPGRRLGARLLDGLVLLPIVVGLVALAVALVAPRAGPIFPRVTPGQTATTPTPGFVWVELSVLGALAVSGVVMVAYETVATARFGRTLGKAWLHIRPLRTTGGTLGWGRSFGRVALYYLAGVFTWLGLLDPLWCLWDDNRQCLHDKAVASIVVNDPLPGGAAGTPGRGDADAQMQISTRPEAGASWEQYPLPPYVPQHGQWNQPPLVPRTNGLAIASLVCSLVGILFIGLPGILGVIFGFIARAQNRRSAGARTGSGMALAGIIVGFAVVAFWTLMFTLSAVYGTHNAS